MDVWFYAFSYVCRIASGIGIGIVMGMWIVTAGSGVDLTALFSATYGGLLLLLGAWNHVSCYQENSIVSVFS